MLTIQWFNGSMVGLVNVEVVVDWVALLAVGSPAEPLGVPEVEEENIASVVLVDEIVLPLGNFPIVDEFEVQGLIEAALAVTVI